MSFSLADVCDFNPWDEPATYAAIVLHLMLIYTSSVWVERTLTFRSIRKDVARLELENGMTGLASIAATATLIGCLGSVLAIAETLRLLTFVRDPLWLAGELAAALVTAAHWARGRLRARVDRLVAASS